MLLGKNSIVIKKMGFFNPSNKKGFQQQEALYQSN